jgi:hypothetical protein
MRILVISPFDVKKLFSNPSKYNIVHVSPKNALRLFIKEPSDIVLAFAEYEGSDFNKAREALADIKNSAPEGVRIFRLGFSKEEKKDGETYLELPLSLLDDNLDKIFS